MTAAIGPVRGIDNVLFPVGDLDQAVAFYTDRIGLPLVFRLDDPGLALFRLGAEPPGLLVRKQIGLEPPNGTTAKVWLEVPDARQTAQALTNAGITTPAPFPVATGWTVEVTDPWGNIVGFTDYTTMPERGRPAVEAP